MFEVKLLTPTAKMPTRGSEQAAGLDICADKEQTQADFEKLAKAEAKRKAKNLKRKVAAQ